MSDPLKETPRPPVILACPTNRNPGPAGLAVLRREVERIIASEQVYSIVTSNSGVTSPAGPHYLFTIKPYFWEVSPGKWERRDGYQNPSIWPSVQQKQLEYMAQDVYCLCLGYFNFEDLKEVCAARIKTILAVFFLDPATRMEPSGKYVQCVPDRIPMEGDYAFAVSIPYLIMLCWALPMLQDCSILTDTLVGVQDWFAEFTRFLLESRQGQLAREYGDNKTVWCHVLVASSYTLHDPGCTARYAKSAVDKLMQDFPTAEHLFKREVARARPAHYALFTLEPLFLLVSLSGYEPIRQEGSTWSTPAARFQTWLGSLVNHARDITPSELESIREAGGRYHVKLRWFEKMLAAWNGSPDERELDGSLWQEGWSDLSQVIWAFI